MDLNQLKMPPVKILYLKNEDNQSQIKEIDRFEYEIYSLNNLTDVSLYHINYNKKAILKCINCGRFFIPSVYETEKYNEETGNDELISVTERITKLTCSEKCQQNLRKDKEFINNNKDFKTKLKNMRDKLGKRDNDREKKGLKPRYYKRLFDKEYKIKEEVVKKKYKNKVKIEYELEKFLEEETIKFDKLYNE